MGANGSAPHDEVCVTLSRVGAGRRLRCAEVIFLSVVGCQTCREVCNGSVICGWWNSANDFVLGEQRSSGAGADRIWAIYAIHMGLINS